MSYLRELLQQVSRLGSELEEAIKAAKAGRDGFLRVWKLPEVLHIADEPWRRTAM